MNFSISGMEPGSDLTFILQDQDGNTVDGLGVQVGGAVVVQVDSQGNFNGNITIPPAADDAVYSLIVNGTRADGSDYARDIAVGVGSESIINAQTDDGDAPPESLAATGASSRTFALNGLLIVGVGIALVAFLSLIHI